MERGLPDQLLPIIKLHKCTSIAKTSGLVLNTARLPGHIQTQLHVPNYMYSNRHVHVYRFVSAEQRPLACLCGEGEGDT